MAAQVNKAKVVLFPTDFSATSDAALPEACALASDRGAALLILHVVAPMLGYGGGEIYGVSEATNEAFAKMLHQIVPPDKRVPYEHRMVTGDPVAEIVRAAAEANAELIVMGTHGRTGIGRLIMGSVAEGVVRRAPCPVLTYRGLSPMPPLGQPLVAAG